MPDFSTIMRLVIPLTTLAIIAYVLLRRPKNPGSDIALVVLVTLASIAVY